MEPEELWKDIDGYNGLYKVSTFGNVYNNIRRAYLTPHLYQGYRKVSLYNKIIGKGKQFKIARLVAEAFIPNPLNLPIPNHKDLNKLNDYVGNLEWVTDQRNTEHAIGKPVAVFDSNKEPIGVYKSETKAAKAMNTSPTMVSNHCMSRQITSTGYYFAWLPNNNLPTRGKAIREDL